MVTLLHKGTVKKLRRYEIFLAGVIVTALETNKFRQVLFRISTFQKVQGEPAGKILISDLPSGGSADHVDQRGV